MGGQLFGLLPTSILGEIGDSLLRTSNRYTCTVSVPNKYHSLAGGLQTLREAAERKRAEEWEQAIQARRVAEATRAAQREARLKCNYKKAKADWYSFGGTSGCGFRAIAKHYEILFSWMRHLAQNE